MNEVLTKKRNDMRLLVDLDGVICAYDFQYLVKETFGVDLDAKEIFAYDLADVLGVSSKVIDDMFHEQVWGKPNFNQGAVTTLREWQTKGYEIAIYSNRVKYMSELGLAKWLIDWCIPFGGIDVEGTGEYNFHIDDSPVKLMSTRSLFKILYSQPWNERCLDIMKCLQRVSNWQEIKQIVG